MAPERLVATLGALLLLAAWGLARRGHPRGWRACSIAALVLVLIFLGFRWRQSGHPPVFGTYDMDLAETAALGALALRFGPALGGPAAFVGALTLVHTLILDPRPTPLTISEQSLWIDLHAAFAWGAWAAYWLALLEAWRCPGPDRRALRLLGLGFLAHTGLAFTGVYYATLLFARAWEWDPVQTLGLLSWLLMAMVLHFRLMHFVGLGRQRVFLAVAVAAFVLSAKGLLLLRAGQTFHVFELGRMAP